MSHVNWEEHRVKFAAMKAEKGTTIKEYSEINGLSFNTARKQLNSKKNGGTAPPDKGDHSGDLLANKGKRSPAKSAKNTREASNKRAKFTKTDVKGQRDSFREPPRKRSVQDDGKALKNNGLKLVSEGGSGVDHTKKIPEKSQKRAARKTAKATKGQMIPLIGRDAVALPGFSAAQEMMAKGADEHLRQAIEMAQNSAIQYQEVVQREATRLQGEIDDIDPGDEIEGVHPSVKLRGLLEDSAYFMNDFITRLASIYQSEKKLQQGAEKLRQAERQQAFREAEAREKMDLARMVAEQRIGADARASRIIADALRMREREELDDIGVAEYIERRGVRVPDILAARAHKALDAIEPPVQEIEVDDDQIEREAEEYAQKLRDHPQWLEARRAEVAKVVEDLGCGDIDTTGERKAGEFEADDEGLDLDPSATSDIYGEYDAGDNGYDDNQPEIAIPPPEDE